MTSYNKDYGIPKPKQHIPYGRVLTPMEKELVKQVQQDKKNWQEKIKRAQALEREAYKRKMQKLRIAARTYEDEPA